MSFSVDSSIPAVAGVGLKPLHFDDILELAQQPQQQTVKWFEIHAENYMAGGGLMHHYLAQIRDKYPLSIHGVGLSLGSVSLPCDKHLSALKALITRYEPGLISEHVSWSQHQDVAHNDLLPVPYTHESMMVFCNNIDKTQTVLGRELLIENPSSYFKLKDCDYSEHEFINELVKRSGCRLLLDVNNVFVSAHNHGFDPLDYIYSIDGTKVDEIHLAGHSVQKLLTGEVRIDDHGSEVCPQVWQLFEATLQHVGVKPTLIEWDSDVPQWPVLSEQANLANVRLNQMVEQ